MTLPTITIGTPMGSSFSVCADFYICMSRLIAYSLQNKVVSKINVLGVSSANIAKNRNLLVKHRGECDYLFMVDTDMTFGPHTLERLIRLSKENPSAVCTGLAFTGNLPHVPALFQFNKETMTGKSIKKVPKKVFEIDACGAFGMLIPDHILKDEKMREPFTRVGELEEDLCFCYRLSESEFKVVCDPTIEFGHIRPGQVRRDKKSVTFEEI